MIALASECLLFQLPSGDSVPVSVEAISMEFSGKAPAGVEPEFLYQVAKTVFYYFRHDLQRQTVTPDEFQTAFAKALSGFKLKPAEENPALPPVLESDLVRLATEVGRGCELFFFPRLREELRGCLQQSPKVLRFHGLRGCTMTLAGARRWTPRCQSLSEEIVTFLRGCANRETSGKDFSLFIE